MRIVIVPAVRSRVGSHPLPQQLALRVLVALVVVAAEYVHLEIRRVSQTGDLVTALLTRARAWAPRARGGPPGVIATCGISRLDSGELRRRGLKVVTTTGRGRVREEVDVERADGAHRPRGGFPVEVSQRKPSLEVRCDERVQSCGVPVAADLSDWCHPGPPPPAVGL